jgi:hypothetical protein
MFREAEQLLQIPSAVYQRLFPEDSCESFLTSYLLS